MLKAVEAIPMQQIQCLPSDRYQIYRASFNPGYTLSDNHLSTIPSRSALIHRCVLTEAMDMQNIRMQRSLAAAIANLIPLNSILTSGQKDSLNSKPESVVDEDPK
jgi:hypothetical protein